MSTVFGLLLGFFARAAAGPVLFVSAADAAGVGGMTLGLGVALHLVERF